MAESEKLVVFLCSSTLKKGNEKLSYRIAEYLAVLGLSTIGSLEQLSIQHATPPALQRRMIFLSDCRAGCVNVLTHGFEKEKFLYVDIGMHAHSASFDIAQYVSSELLPMIETKWHLRLFKESTGYEPALSADR